MKEYKGNFTFYLIPEGDGKTWTARSASGRVIPKDTLVKVQRMEGVRLFVEEEAAQPVHS